MNETRRPKKLPRGGDAREAELDDSVALIANAAILKGAVEWASMNDPEWAEQHGYERTDDINKIRDIHKIRWGILQQEKANLIRRGLRMRCEIVRPGSRAEKDIRKGRLKNARIMQMPNHPDGWRECYLWRIEKHWPPNPAVPRPRARETRGGGACVAAGVAVAAAVDSDADPPPEADPGDPSPKPSPERDRAPALAARRERILAAANDYLRRRGRGRP